MIELTKYVVTGVEGQKRSAVVILGGMGGCSQREDIQELTLMKHSSATEKRPYLSITLGDNSVHILGREKGKTCF